jgi:hypothetical protein
MAAKKRNREIPVLEQKLRENPRSRMFSRLADLHREDGNLDDAIATCTAGLAEHPDYITGRLVLGRCYKEQRNFTAAVGELTKVCAADDRNLAALKMLAEIYTAMGKTETAGSLYGILYHMEPDNPAIQQAAAKNKHRQAGSAHEILGIKQTSAQQDAAIWGAAESQPDTMFAEQTIAFSTENAMNDIAQSGISGADIENQLDTMFTEQTIAMPVEEIAAEAGYSAGETTGMVTGSDIESQLDSMFGGQTLSVPTGEPDMVTGSDIESQLDSIFGEQSAPAHVPAPVESAPAPVAVQGIDETYGIDAAMGPTGSDVENTIDAMFGGQTAPAAPIQSIPILETVKSFDETDEINIVTGPTGSDIENTSDAMFGGQAAPAPMQITPAAEHIKIIDEADSSVEDQLLSLFGDEDPSTAAIDFPDTPDIADILT